MKITVPRYEGVRGLPGESVTFTNSERAKAICGRRWWYWGVERLQSPQTAAQSFGSAWHACLEEVHLHWRDHETLYDGMPTGIDEYEANLKADGTLLPDEIARERERLEMAVNGWFYVYSRHPYSSYRVVDVEVPISRVITHPGTDTPFAPRMHYVRDRGSLRLAATGEISGAVALPDGASIETHKWPWYQVAKLDCILQHRRTGALLVGEWKTSASPSILLDGLAIDPQTDGYVWVLERAVKDGLLPGIDPNTPVRGYLYDVTYSSKHSKPTVLAPKPVKMLDDDGNPIKKGRSYVYLEDEHGEKVLQSPGLSRATNKMIPSWVYRDECIENGFDPSDYLKEIKELESRVDPKLYLRDFGTAGEEVRERYAEEAYATAAHLAHLHYKAASARDLTDLNVSFPRVPICRLPGGYCSYRGPCLQDGEEIRRNYEIGETQIWEED